jgi:hypothetical protein
MIWRAGPSLECVANFGSIAWMASPHVSANAGSLPLECESNFIMSNLLKNDRADRFASPEAVAPDDTIGHD